MMSFESGLAQLRASAANESPVQLASAYLRFMLQRQNGRQYLGARTPGSPRRSAETLGHREFLRTYQLKKVRADAHAGWLGWVEGRYPLDLIFTIPTPRQMLDRQCEGRRYVTLLLADEDQNRPLGRHDGALAFLLHDLEHAHKYFSDPALAIGQRRFFIQLRSVLSDIPIFDALQSHELDYVLSDMNSHPLHMLKYLKAILLNAFERTGRRAQFDQTFAGLIENWGLPPAPAQRLNHSEVESEADRRELSAFFMEAL